MSRGAACFLITGVGLALATGLATADEEVARTPRSVAPDMVAIEGGTFEMGVEGVEGGEFDEGPVHSVTLSGFSVSRTEITVAQYRAYADARGKSMPEPPSWGWQDSHPIVNVSWNDATDYAAWLSEATGETYRLPTEAEWEYVARSRGVVTTYPWGDGEPTGNLGDQAAKRTAMVKRVWPDYDDGFPYTSPVGSFPPNGLMVLDIEGNAAEWCANHHYTYTGEPQVDPEGPAEGDHRVFRGGSFISDAWYSRIAQRNFMGPEFRANYLGLRVVKSPKVAR